MENITSHSSYISIRNMDNISIGFLAVSNTSKYTNKFIYINVSYSVQDPTYRLLNTHQQIVISFKGS